MRPASGNDVPNRKCFQSHSVCSLLSVFAQFLMTRKVLENWTLWIIADIVYIGVYTSKSLYWTAGLYVIFLGLCIEGYREWTATAVSAPAAF